jgi:hypothetical protein
LSSPAEEDEEDMQHNAWRKTLPWRRRSWRGAEDEPDMEEEGSVRRVSGARRLSGGAEEYGEDEQAAVLDRSEG